MLLLLLRDKSCVQASSMLTSALLAMPVRSIGLCMVPAAAWTSAAAPPTAAKTSSICCRSSSQVKADKLQAHICWMAAAVERSPCQVQQRQQHLLLMLPLQMLSCTEHWRARLKLYQQQQQQLQLQLLQKRHLARTWQRLPSLTIYQQVQQQQQQAWQQLRQSNVSTGRTLVSWSHHKQEPRQLQRLLDVLLRQQPLLLL
jgi:hypothetical protein